MKNIAICISMVIAFYTVFFVTLYHNVSEAYYGELNILVGLLVFTHIGFTVYMIIDYKKNMRRFLALKEKYPNCDEVYTSDYHVAWTYTPNPRVNPYGKSIKGGGYTSVETHDLEEFDEENEYPDMDEEVIYTDYFEACDDE